MSERGRSRRCTGSKPPAPNFVATTANRENRAQQTSRTEAPRRNFQIARSTDGLEHSDFVHWPYRQIRRYGSAVSIAPQARGRRVHLDDYVAAGIMKAGEAATLRVAVADRCKTGPRDATLIASIEATI